MLQTDFVINGRYRIFDTLGVGGMGTVYAAQDERLGRHVALKVLRPEIVGDQRARERFLGEAQIAAQLVHPNIVRTYDVGEAPEGPFLVQELLDGQTLDTQLPLSPALATVVATGVADALHAIHSQGYVHCDIKPQNIMLVGERNQPRVVLLDFGIARVEGTETTTLIATPHYLAPERALGAAPTAASDLYALGIVLFQALAGQPPFDAPALHAIIEQHRSAPLPPLKIATGGMPGETRTWEAIIRKLTAKEPEQRYPSAAALRDELTRLAPDSVHAQLTQVVTERPKPASVARKAPPPPATQVPEPTRRPTNLRYLALPLLLGALLIGALVSRQSPAATGATEPSSVNVAQPTAVEASPSAAAIAASAVPAADVVTVPNVVGQPLDIAQAQLQAAGLQSVVETTVVSEQPVGNVIGTVPAPDQQLAAGGTVQLHVSGGAPVVEPVPDDKEDKEDKEDKDEKKEEDKGKGKGKGKKDD